MPRSFAVPTLSGVALAVVLAGPLQAQNSSRPMNPPTLDPEAQALLDRIAAESAKQPAPPPDADPFAAARAGYRATIPLAGKPVNLPAVTDRTLPGPDGQPLTVRVYVPRAGGRPLPSLVYLHGGGFTAGDLDTHDAPLRALSKAADCLVVAVAYLRPQAQSGRRAR